MAESPVTPEFMAEDRLNAMARMVIMVGFSRTGKSTYVNRMVRAMADAGHAFAVVSGDDVQRTMGVRYNSKLEDQVRATLIQVAHALMIRGQNVVIDETNLTIKERVLWMAMAQRHNYVFTIIEIECLDEETHQRECLKHKYPWDVIVGQKRRYQPVGAKDRDRYTLITRKELE